MSRFAISIQLPPTTSTEISFGRFSRVLVNGPKLILSPNDNPEVLFASFKVSAYATKWNYFFDLPYLEPFSFPSTALLSEIEVAEYRGGTSQLHFSDSVPRPVVLMELLESRSNAFTGRLFETLRRHGHASEKSCLQMLWLAQYWKR